MLRSIQINCCVELGFRYSYIWITHLWWSSEEKRPLWDQGWAGACTSLPDASTDCSRANSRAPTPPVTAPIAPISCSRHAHNKYRASSVDRNEKKKSKRKFEVRSVRVLWNARCPFGDLWLPFCCCLPSLKLRTGSWPVKKESID